MNKVAVIILNYNSSSDCKKCASFLEQQEGVDLELVFVDNASSDGYIVKDFCENNGYTFIQSKENRGYNAGNNIGLRYAAEKGYEYAMIANPDMEFPEKDYIRKLVEEMNIDQDIVVVGSNILGNDGKCQNPLKRDGNWTTSFFGIKELIFKKKQTWLDDSNYSHYCSKVNGCCFLIKIEFIKSIGFFDEYPFLYCEEPILSRQIEVASKKIFYCAEVTAIHRHISSTKGNPIKRLKNWRRSRLYFIDVYSKNCLLGKIIEKINVLIYINTLIVVKKWKK